MTKHNSPGKRYDVTIKGEYFTTRDGHQTCEPYEETITVTQKMVMDHGPLVPFVRHWAPVHMREKYAGYTGLATHYIKEAFATDDHNELLTDARLMNHTQMLEHIEAEELPIKTALYHDDDALRQAILDWEEAVKKRDEDSFIRNQDKQVAIKKDRIELRNEVLLLNANAAKEDRQPAASRQAAQKAETTAPKANGRPSSNKAKTAVAAKI